MRKVILVLVSGVLFGVADAAAQVPKYEFGPAVGVSIANLVDSDDDADSRTAPYFGGTLVLNPAASVAFETGLLYMPKGASGSFNDVTTTIKLDYVEIPFLVRLGYNMEGSSVRAVVLLGGYVGIKSSCKFKLESDEASVEFDCDDPQFEEEEGAVDVNSLDLGVSAGVGLDIAVSERMVLAPVVRYSRGLSDIVDEEGSAKNSALQLGASLRFKF